MNSRELKREARLSSTLEIREVKFKLQANPAAEE